MPVNLEFFRIITIVSECSGIDRVYLREEGTRTDEDIDAIIRNII